MAKFIVEQVNDVEFITETVDGKKSRYLVGKFMQAEQLNKNGRKYPFNVLMKESARYNRDYVEKNRAFGELGHPASPTINLDKVSHLITKLYPEGNDFIGKAKILDTPNGMIVQNLLDGGASLGVSTRGVGSLKEHNGYQLVQDDFHLATAADIVADPSAPDAWVSAIMEQSEWVLTNKGWTEVDYDRAKKQLQEASRQEIEETALKLFKNFMSKL